MRAAEKQKTSLFGRAKSKAKAMPMQYASSRKNSVRPPDPEPGEELINAARINPNWEFKMGYYINPNPTVALTTPPAPPPPTPEEKAARDAADEAATKDIPNHLAKYMEIVRNVNLFSEMGIAEIESAALALTEPPHRQKVGPCGPEGCE